MVSKCNCPLDRFHLRDFGEDLWWHSCSRGSSERNALLLDLEWEKRFTDLDGMRETVGNRAEDNHGFNQGKSGGRAPRRGQPASSRLWVRVVLGSSTVQVPGLPDGSGRPAWAHRHLWAKMMGEALCWKLSSKKVAGGGLNAPMKQKLAPRKRGVNSTPEQPVLLSSPVQEKTVNW